MVRDPAPGLAAALTDPELAQATKEALVRIENDRRGDREEPLSAMAWRFHGP